MKIVQREDKETKEPMYSADIHCTHSIFGDFTVPMLDVRDGPVMRKEVELMDRKSGKSSKFIPKKQVLNIE